MSSSQNALVKRAASLRVRKYREREAAFLVEGADLVAAGLAAGLRPQAVFVTAGSPAHAAALGGGPFAGLSGEALAELDVSVVDARVAAHISTLESAPDTLAVFPLPLAAPPAQLRGAETLVVYADHLADPGNMGTLIRAAAAFGAAALATSPESVDLFSPKVVRASMGAVFALPLYAGVPLAELVHELGAPRVYGLAAHGGRALADAPLVRPAVLCVGAERAGLSPQVLAVLDETLTIALVPARGATQPAGAASPAGPGAPAAGGRPALAPESLNAGVAGAIALYEFSRSRAPQAHGDPLSADVQARSTNG